MTMKAKNILFFLIVGLFTIHLNAEIRFEHRTNCYCTHHPILFEVVSLTTGPIIEFGCGYGSTDFLHEMCKENKRVLISLDDDLDRIKRFKEKYQGDSEWHKIIFVPGKPDDIESPEHWVKFLYEFLRNTTFDLCVIDQHPWLGRYETLQFMKDKAKFIVLHDCDYFPRNGIFGRVIRPTIHFYAPGVFDFSDVFKWYKVYFPLYPWPGESGPPTLLGSNFEENLPDVDYYNYP